MEKQTLQRFLENFYELHNICVYLLDQDKNCCYENNSLFQLDDGFFKTLYHGYQKNLGKISIILLHYEFHVLIPCEVEECRYISMGPFLYYRSIKEVHNMEHSFLRTLHYKEDMYHIIKQLPYLDNTLRMKINFIYQLLYEDKITREDIKKTFQYSREQLLDEESLQKILYAKREETPQYSYEGEQALLKAIKEGDSTTARSFGAKIASGHIGYLSEDALRKSKYALVAAIAIITRAVIEVGVPVASAYGLSDSYISKADAAFHSAQLHTLMMDCIIDFCKLVKNQSHSEFPKWIRSIMEYCGEHLHEQIDLTQLGDVVHMNPAYISVQFKKITGYSITHYINEQRIHEAKYLLRFTDTTIQDIAMTLNFSSQSYFAKVFYEFTGEKPNAYRR